MIFYFPDKGIQSLEIGHLGSNLFLTVTNYVSLGQTHENLPHLLDVISKSFIDIL